MRFVYTEMQFSRWKFNDNWSLVVVLHKFEKWKTPAMWQRHGNWSDRNRIETKHKAVDLTGNR